MRIAVVAAGLAGLRAAEQLCACGSRDRVTVVGDEPFRPYTRPPLFKEVLAKHAAGSLVGALTGTSYERLPFGALDQLLGRPARLRFRSFGGAAERLGTRHA